MSVSRDEDDDRLIATALEVDLQATWAHMIITNLEARWNTVEERKKLLSNIWPKDCMQVTLRSSSTTSRRGKRPRAYPRKGIVKVGDKKASKVKIGLHQLAAWKSSNSVGQPGDQASHWFCDNEACVNPSHVVWESSGANSTRFCCKLYSSTKNYRCPHKPTCPNCVSCFVNDDLIKFLN